jgi:L-asparagine transporter-like permease
MEFLGVCTMIFMLFFIVSMFVDIKESTNFLWLILFWVTLSGLIVVKEIHELKESCNKTTHSS